MEKIKNLIIGDRLILDLGHESFVGDLQFINQDRTRLAMINVKNLNTKEIYTSKQYYYTSDIVCIHCDNDDNAEDDNDDDSESAASSNNNLNIMEYEKNNIPSLVNLNNAYQHYNNDQNSQSGSEKIISLEQEYNIEKKNMKLHEFNKIDNCLDNIKYIIQTDITYHNAIKDLNNQKLIAIYIEPCKFGRNDGPTTIITIYSPDTNYVYIFDINFIGAIHKEFVKILINPKIIKICFDGRILYDHMKYKHNIELNRIFDCLASHLIITKNYKKLNLRACLMKYINIPNNYLCDTEDEIDWHSRPLDDTKKLLVCKTVVFLYKLYEIHNQILQNKMLQNFENTCNIFAQTYSSNEDMVSVAVQMSTDDKNASISVCKTNINDHLDLDLLKYKT